MYGGKKRGGSGRQLVLGRYELGSSLGAGSFAKVYLGMDIKETNRKVAIKLIQSNATAGQGAAKYLENIQTEVEAMLQIGHHPNIVQLYDYGKTESYFVLVLEYCGGGDIASLIKRLGRFEEPQVRKFATELASALQCMRKFNISHRDLKPQNLLLSSKKLDEAHLKIADFGFARQVTNDTMI
jgi:serine/threonine protein kinase